jgi:beta-glucosidase
MIMGKNQESQKNWENRIEELLEQLTLEEKIGMIHGAGLFRTEGVKRLGIPPLHMSDGPMGVRAEFADREWRSVGTTDDFVSYLPCNSAIASTWNREMAEKAGFVLGEETRGRGKDVILAPGINIKRSPLCGRNFEYMSEDPKVVEELVTPLVKGIQENDVAACVKHFAANSQETERLWVDTVADERTLQEIYFPGFRAAIEKGGIFSLMGAYNRLNGEHCCTGTKLLGEVLRGQWKFDGMIVSDWGGVHDTKLAAESPLDIEMDVTYQFNEHHMADPLLEQIRAGELSETLVDEKVRNILRLMLRLNMIGEGRENRKRGSYNTKEHQRAALEIAEESVILLKNETGILPLDEKKLKKVAVIGANAAAIHSNGGGSAEIKALYEISPLLGIKQLLGGNAEVSYATGYVVPGKAEADAINWQADSTKHTTETLSEKAKEQAGQNTNGETTPQEEVYRREALQLAKEADAVIFIGGLNHEYDVEGKDRADMKLPYGQDELLEELLSVRKDTVVVLYAGAPVEMPWIAKADTVLWSYYAGMEGGTAIAEVLFGKVNPSGKLAETLLKDITQCPAHTIGTFGKKDKVEYKEGVMVGYRYYDTEQTPVLFPFGHGLSYSSFQYSDLRLEKVSGKDETRHIKVSFRIKNKSDMAGKEIAQIYVAPKHPSVKRPVHELKAFEKIALAAGEEKEVALHLSEKDFSYYNEEAACFTVDEGSYEIQVAASSRDIRLTGAIQI